MALTIFLAGVVLILMALAYDYWRGTHQSKALSNTILAHDHELKRLKESERGLKEEVELLQGKLSHTFTDPVTNLIGWKVFEDRMKQAIKESERHHFTLAVMMVDLDDFKTINDALSHDVGDALLKEVAGRLQECVREVDNISRFTKDTFVVMLTQLAKPETAAIIAQRILQSLAQPFQVANQELYVTACVGIALFPADGQDASVLLRNADHALHLAKTRGKYLAQFYEESMHVQSQRDLVLANSLSREENFQQIDIYFQPIMDVKLRTIVCLDVSMCWHHPELGVIDTSELLEQADKHRRLNALSAWMLKSACQQYMKLRQSGVNLGMLGLPITVKQLENTHFVYELSQILQSQGFKPEWLLIEIKENFNHASFDVLEKAFNMLHYLGVKIAIDRFGANSLALRYFKVMTIQYLKLDSVFTADVAENMQARALLKSIHFFAQMMSIQLVVTGVDEAAQVSTLKELGCMLMQGSAICEPLPAQEVVKKIQPSIA